MDTQTKTGIGGIAASSALLFVGFIWPRMSPIVTYPGLAISVAIAAWGFGPILRGLGPYSWRYVPLHMAARRLYEKTLDSGIAQIARSSNSDDVLETYGVWICDTNRLPLYGKRPPSQALEPIPLDTVKRLRFSQGSSELWERVINRRVAYTDLMVRRWDLWRRWSALRRPND